MPNRQWVVRDLLLQVFEKQAAGRVLRIIDELINDFSGRHPRPPLGSAELFKKRDNANPVSTAPAKKTAGGVRAKLFKLRKRSSNVAETFADRAVAERQRHDGETLKPLRRLPARGKPELASRPVAERTGQSCRKRFVVFTVAGGPQRIHQHRALTHQLRMSSAWGCDLPAEIAESLLDALAGSPSHIREMHRELILGQLQRHRVSGSAKRPESVLDAETQIDGYLDFVTAITSANEWCELRYLGGLYSYQRTWGGERPKRAS